MEISEKILKPVKETNYLNVDNTDRYRPILRLFYINYEKLKYWMYQEDIYDELKEDSYFSEYTIEQCQQDLSTLVSWGNLLTIQDTKKVSSIEEFKNKKFRYQMSPYAVEIERLVIHLENLFIEGASLEPTLLERIRNSLAKLQKAKKEPPDRIHGWWNDLNNDFVRLNQNYQDYMRALNSVKAEEMMKTRQFLAFKDKLVEYLRNFVKGLQLNVNGIEQLIRQIEKEKIGTVLETVIAYEMSIPRMDVEADEEQISEKVRGRWKSIAEWFISRDGKESEAGKVFDTTNEIIRKITRYATRISELSSQGANRREEYYKLATLFAKCNSLNEAHRLSATVFGAEKPLHIRADIQRATESINSGVYEEKPCVIPIMPRVRTYREKTKRTGITDRTEEKQAMRIAEENRLAREKALLQSYIQGNRLEFATLPVLEPQVRDTFLVWLSRALERKDLHAKTEEGIEYHIEEEKGKRCTLQCTDGTFTMPAYTICFEEQKDSILS